MSLIDEFDSHTDSGSARVSNRNTYNEEALVSGYVNVKNPTKVQEEEEAPIFSLVKVDYKPTEQIRHLVVSNHILIIALQNSHIIRINLKKSEEIEDIEISKKEQIHKVFIDGSGNHLIISMENEENYYLNIKWKKPKLLTKMKGILVESVAWDKISSDTNSTGTILIGTSKGKIFETIIDALNERSFMGFANIGSKDIPFKPVYYMGDTVPITGLRYEKITTNSNNSEVGGMSIPGSNTSINNSNSGSSSFGSYGANSGGTGSGIVTENGNKYFIIATTPTRIYQFIGINFIESVFSNYEATPSFIELPGDILRSELQFYSQFMEGLPKSFAWLTGPGIYYGNLVFGSQNPGDSIVGDGSLLTYSSLQTNHRDSNNLVGSSNPISLAMTEFHFVLLYEDRIQAVSVLNKQVVWEEFFSKAFRAGKTTGLAFDAASKLLFLYTASGVFEVVVTKEDRNVWYMYLEKGMFEDALRYTVNPQQRDKVWTVQADYYFNNGNYKLAAEYYGRTLRPFEEISLKFIAQNDFDALKSFLFHKLVAIKPQSTTNNSSTLSKGKGVVADATQITMIATWLTELYLDKLNQLNLLINNPSPQSEELNNNNNKQARQTMSISDLRAREEVILEEFYGFLKEYKSNLDRATTFNLISSHGRLELLLYYATLIEDYERVISHHIQQEKYLDALDVLSRQFAEENYYKFSPVLMNKVPYECVNSWIKAHSSSSCKLDPRKLIPALMRYDPSKNPPNDKTNQAIRYLQHCVRKLDNKDPAIHNYLLSLYASQSDDKPLTDFLQRLPAYYDEKYALRLCTKEGKTRACVMIYSRMGLHEEAVDMALKVGDIDSAKIHANKPDESISDHTDLNNLDLKKKLWLRIARFVVEEKKDIKLAMEILSESEILKIEDILPFFPDFTRIDQFKEEIITSLEDYNRHIEDLKVEMEEATKSADLIRVDIKDLRNKYGYVSSTDVCVICEYALLGRDFYIFPCRHGFHTDCLTKEVLKSTSSLNPIQRLRATELIDLIKRGGNKKSTNVNSNSDSNFDDGSQSREKLKEELDEIIAGECLLCGDAIIKSIADPFVYPDEREAIESWAI